MSHGERELKGWPRTDPTIARQCRPSCIFPAGLATKAMAAKRSKIRENKLPAFCVPCAFLRPTGSEYTPQPLRYLTKPFLR
jgi:hypothetical protein